MSFNSADCCPLMLSSKSKMLLCDSFNGSKCAEQKRKISKHQLSHKLEVGLKWKEKLGAMVQASCPGGRRGIFSWLHLFGIDVCIFEGLKGPHHKLHKLHHKGSITDSLELQSKDRLPIQPWQIKLLGIAEVTPEDQPRGKKCTKRKGFLFSLLFRACVFV